MFYPSYDDYMRDIFYYNGLAGNNMAFQANPGASGYMVGPGYMNNGGYMGGMQNCGNNINNLYPSIYRIVYPVVQKVTSENNFQVINDEIVTNTTDTIYNIVEGDLNSAQNCNSNSSSQRNMSSSSNSNTSSSNNNQNMQTSSYSVANSSSNNQSQSRKQ